MTVPIERLLVPATATIREALAALDASGTGFLAVVDDGGRLAGVATDGDVRRALLRGSAIDDPVSAAMNAACVALPVDATDAAIGRVLDGPISFVPLLDGERRPVDWAGRGRHHRLPVMEPLLDGNELAYVEEAVRTGWVSSQGRFVGRFEAMFGELHGVPHALAVSNGTVDYIKSGGFGVNCIGGAGGCIDLDGSTGNGGRMTSKQTFNLLANETYRLIINVSGNQRGGANDEVSWGLVTSGGASLSGIAPGAAFTAQDFTSSSNLARVEQLFIETSSNDNVGVIIDNVLFECVTCGPNNVPEPTALGLLGLGLAGLGLARKRR